jgi:O-acetyl-ADP-ribose deacetylase (regulator of RNase III)
LGADEVLAWRSTTRHRGPLFEGAMRWRVWHGDILDVPADVLICSANVYLTLSGGVGGAFLLRYGPAVQENLRQYLTDRGVRYVPRGTVVETPPCGSPYRAVLHAVAVDGFYDTTPAVVGEVIRAGLRRAAALSARTVALAGLAMGYGRLPVGGFAEAVRPLIGLDAPPVETVVVGLRSRDDVEGLLALVPALEEAT